MRPLLLALIFISVAPLARIHAEDNEARALVQRVVDAQLTRGFIIRAKVTVSDSASDLRRVAQIRVKGRRDHDGTRMLYEVLWPAPDKGAAVCLERPVKGNLTGFSFMPPDKTEPITAERLATSYLDSDLNLEDLIEDFWQWPDPKAGGAEQINKEMCRIINLRPPPEAKSSYSLVRAWISEEKAVPFRLVKFNQAGQPAKEFAIQKILRDHRFWVPVATQIQKPGKTQQTVVEISRGDRDLDIPVATFSLEQIKKAAPAN